MNEVDVERQRLIVRVLVTKYLSIAGIMVSIFFILQLTNQYLEFDATYLVIGGLTVFAFDNRLESRIKKFYEKRLMNSKSRQHTL